MNHSISQHTLATKPVDISATARVMAIGKFDGLHIAHQSVLKQAVRRAEQGLGDPCLFAFTPHPRLALTGDQAYVRWLTPPSERAILARNYGVQCSYVAEFHHAFQRQTAQEFVVDYLIPLGTRHIVVGYDFRFGKGGAYTTADLSEIALAYGISCDVVDHIDVDGAPVSSSRIRSALSEADIQKATRLLGRPYQWRAKVITGDQRGRTIGFPTANLDLLEPFVIPAAGVYGVDCMLADGTTHRGMLNIGVRPTVKVQGQLTLEAHLLHFSGDLYGQEMVVRFLGHLRNERKFASLDELRKQLAQDAASAAEL
ncbi:MAG: riboflavin biosynthesis protein RibF [Firmicutes bacterium]|nr:riboflavin biosynthesis protein RibF [Bacillota bacterium]